MSNFSFFSTLKLYFVSLIFCHSSFAQKTSQPTSSEIFQKIQKLNVLGSVLYLAAHPDDENTRFIAYCANEKLLDVAYLSLTRGSGGQNRIGSEIREGLGIIRTQELLSARRIDGGKQFFARANDFGYSKTSEETLEIWDREKVLADIIWVIRKIRPDVIVLRFPPNKQAGHGHHTSSALLGIEAFEKAADEKFFPEQLKWVKPWQATRIVTNTGRWWNPEISAEDENVVSEDIGTYNSSLGLSMNEIAAFSRSQHKSQGFGATPTRGSHLEFFEHQKGKKAYKSLFDDIETTWKRVKNSKKVEALVSKIEANYSIDNPSKNIPSLIELRKELDKLEERYWKDKKIAEVNELIKDCAGVYLEAVANDYSGTTGDSIQVEFEVLNRTNTSTPIKVISIVSSKLSAEHNLNEVLSYNKNFNPKFSYLIPDLPISQPYWIKEKGSLGMYKVDDPLLIGKPESDPAISFEIDLSIDNEIFTYSIPLIYKWNDPVKGGLYRPFVITPPVFVNFQDKAKLFTSKEDQVVELKVKAGKENFNGVLKLEVPKGWRIEPESFPVSLRKKGDEIIIKTLLSPKNKPTNGFLKASIRSGENTFDYSLNEIAYDHIPHQVYFPEASTQLVYIDLEKKSLKIGYIEGAGDIVPQSLKSIGFEVDILEENDITKESLHNYNTVILGIRALNTNERVGFMMPKLLHFVKEGGTLVIQYNTSFRLKTDQFSPYTLQLSRDRVTEENSKVTFLAPDHPVLNYPNKITQLDFEDWVQERGLYFPDKWGDEYTPILRWNDKGESQKDGALLIASYGKGHYVYTGISFFRQFPAGVSGAFRLFTNIISLGE